MHQLLEVFRSNLQALYRYRPQPYSGQVVLFSATEQASKSTSDSSNGWGQLVGENIDIYKIPGDHYSIIQEPNVEILATGLKSYLKLKDP